MAAIDSNCLNIFLEALNLQTYTPAMNSVEKCDVSVIITEKLDRGKYANLTLTLDFKKIKNIFNITENNKNKKRKGFTGPMHCVSATRKKCYIQHCTTRLMYPNNWWYENV